MSILMLIDSNLNYFSLSNLYFFRIKLFSLNSDPLRSLRVTRKNLTLVIFLKPETTIRIDIFLLLFRFLIQQDKLLKNTILAICCEIVAINRNVLEILLFLFSLTFSSPRKKILKFLSLPSQCLTSRMKV